MKYAWFSIFRGSRNPTALILPRFLSLQGCKIIATRGTARFFVEHEVPATEVAVAFSGTRFGEQFVSYDERIARAILRGSTEPFFRELSGEGSEIAFDVVCAILTPYYVHTMQDAGGMSVLNLAIAAQKPVIASPLDYELVLEWIKKGKPSRGEFAYGLARIAAYDLTRYTLTVAHPGKHQPLGSQARYDDTPSVLKLDAGADHLRAHLKKLLESKEAA